MTFFFLRQIQKNLSKPLPIRGNKAQNNKNEIIKEAQSSVAQFYDTNVTDTKDGLSSAPEGNLTSQTANKSM